MTLIQALSDKSSSIKSFIFWSTNNRVSSYNVKELLDPNYLQNRLLEVRDRKEKLLKKLASAEEYEQILVEEIHKTNSLTF